jgi:hypothetical protein
MIMPKSLVLQVIPDLVGQAGAVVGNLPVVDHVAQFLDRAVEEGLFLGVSSCSGFLMKRPQRGRPENSSPSNPTVPASSAIRSVSEICGVIFSKLLRIGAVMSSRRHGQVIERNGHGQEQQPGQGQQDPAGLTGDAESQQ